MQGRRKQCRAAGAEATILGKNNREIKEFGNFSEGRGGSCPGCPRASGAPDPVQSTPVASPIPKSEFKSSDEYSQSCDDYSFFNVDEPNSECDITTVGNRKEHMNQQLRQQYLQSHSQKSQT